MNHYILFYDFIPEYGERRAAYREEHLRLGWAAHERGELVLAGALANPMDMGVLLFKGESPAVAENFAKGDPYVKNGLVTKWQVRQWSSVIGITAANPVRP